jgi:hypothetical protein
VSLREIRLARSLVVTRVLAVQWTELERHAIERRRVMVRDIRFIDDVMGQLAGMDMASLHQRRQECTAAGAHRWRELQTNVVPPATYCEHCLLVSLKGLEFWPVAPNEKGGE